MKPKRSNQLHKLITSSKDFSNFRNHKGGKKKKKLAKSPPTCAVILSSINKYAAVDDAFSQTMKHCIQDCAEGALT